MKAKDDLEAAWKRLGQALFVLDAAPPPGPARARTLREGMTRYLNGLADGAEGRKLRCPEHPTEYAFNCGICRSERDGRPAHEQPHPSAYPDTSPEAREINARILGEQEREQR